MTIDRGLFLHRIRQYLHSPSKKTFKDVYEVLDLVYDVVKKEYVKPLKMKVDRKSVIGHVLGRIGKCPDSSNKCFDFATDEMLKYLQKLRKFETDFGSL